MFLLVSDYDGTLKPYEKNPNIIEKEIFKKNLLATKKFMEKGNIFSIATGRSTDSIKDEVSKYNINYDYLLTYNGRVILDKHDNIVYANYIDKSFIEFLIKNKEIIKGITLYNEYGLTKSPKNIIYIKLRLKEPKDSKKLIEEINEKYPEIKMDYNIIFKDISIRNNFNKGLGIEELIHSKKLEITKDKIITVGDEINDIEMLEEYNGYRMIVSHPKLLLSTSNYTTSIHKLIKKIN